MHPMAHQVKRRLVIPIIWIAHSAYEFQCYILVFSNLHIQFEKIYIYINLMMFYQSILSLSILMHVFLFLYFQSSNTCATILEYM
jgi:hypothetical protein